MSRADSQSNRRQFFRGALGAGTLAGLGLNLQPARAAAAKLKIAGAREVASVCPYCAVGCGQIISVRDGQIVNIEGNPDSPISRGTLCPKGSATFQLAVNPNRLTKVKYRAPHAAEWEEKDLDWAMDRIAERIRATRDETFVERTPDGKAVNHTTAIATLGGATMDVEENYLIKKLFSGGLGVVSIENQARI